MLNDQVGQSVFHFAFRDEFIGQAVLGQLAVKGSFMEGYHHNEDVRKNVFYHTGSLQAGLVGHIDVHQDHIRMQFAGKFNCLVPVKRFGYDLYMAQRFNELAYRFPKKMIIVGNKNSKFAQRNKILNC